MRKFTLISLLVIFALGSFAQRSNTHKSLKLTKDQNNELVTRYTDKANYENALKAFGDTIYYDDFGTGGPGTGDLPTGWTTEDIDAQGNNYVWQYTTVGATGPTTGGYEHVLASTTAGNGWLILDSDNYSLGSYDAFLYSPAYDLSQYEAVAVSFEELYQRWGNEGANPYGGNPTFLGVSTDGGNTWTEIELHADFDVKDATDNPGYYMVNVSNIAGNEPAVNFYFRMQGYWDYWWQIDDFKIIEAPHYDLIMKDTYLVSAYELAPQQYGLFGYYSMLPMSQVTPFHMEAAVYNNGIQTSTNAIFSAEIYLDGSLNATNTDEIAEIQFDSTYSFVPEYFTPSVAGEWSVQYSVEASVADELAADNIAEPIAFNTTANDIMARDVTFTTALSPSLYTGGGDGDLLGVNYFISNNAQAHSISVYIDWRATPGLSTIVGELYRYDTDRILQISSEEYTITENDLGTWITLPFIEIAAGDADLVAGTEYIAGVSFYWGNDEAVRAWIGADTEGPHVYNLVSVLRLGADWYWTTNVPMIRLNLATATLPPVWNSIINGICAHPSNAGSYDIIVSASDPNGLPLSFSFDPASNDIVSNFVDNGNGTATFTIDMEPSLIEESFLFEYSVSNGVADNPVFQRFEVVSDVECFTINVNEFNAQNPIRIYPNPSTGIVNIDNAEQSIIQVYNILGSLIIETNNNLSNATLNLSSLAEGTYYIKVRTNNQVVSKQVILVK